jgi:hypothetical protein
MDCMIVILKFFGGLFLIFGLSGLIGYLLKLDSPRSKLQKVNFQQEKAEQKIQN